MDWLCAVWRLLFIFIWGKPVISLPKCDNPDRFRLNLSLLEDKTAIRCKECKQIVLETEKFCKECGTPVFIP